MFLLSNWQLPHKRIGMRIGWYVCSDSLRNHHLWRNGIEGFQMKILRWTDTPWGQHWQFWVSQKNRFLSNIGHTFIFSTDLVIHEIQVVFWERKNTLYNMSDKIQFTLTLIHFHFCTVHHQLSHRQKKVSVWLLRMASEMDENTPSQLSSTRSQSRRQQRRPLRPQRPQQQRRLQNSGSTSHSPPSDLPWVELKNQIYLDLEVEE